MVQIFTDDSVILEEIENAKTNNNIVSYHLVSRRVISTLLDVQRVYRYLERSFMLPKKVSCFSFT